MIPLAYRMSKPFVCVQGPSKPDHNSSFHLRLQMLSIIRLRLFTLTSVSAHPFSMLEVPLYPYKTTAYSFFQNYKKY